MARTQDKQAELQHNRSIMDRAEIFWGWNTPAGQCRGQRRVDQFLEYLRPCAGKHFLEIGCGKGWFTQRMKDCGARITAIDLQEDFVAVARERLSHAPARFLVADCEFLPFSGEIFDGVYTTAVLHHLPVETTLQELRRVLKPGAKLIFAEPNMLNPQLLLMKNIRWIGERMGESPNETAFFKWQIRGLLRQCGFDNIHVEPFDFLHPQTPPAAIQKVERLGRMLEKIPLVREIAGSLDIRATKGAVQ